MNYSRFFGRDADEVARDLVGRLLVRNLAGGTTGGRITEVGAYERGKEIASRAGMKYSPGKIFFMPFRGSLLFNIAAGKEGIASCVEVRRLSFHDGDVKGSGAVTNYFELDETYEGVLLGGDLEIIGEGVDASQIKKLRAPVDNCLGYFTLRR